MSASRGVIDNIKESSYYTKAANLPKLSRVSGFPLAITEPMNFDCKLRFLLLESTFIKDVLPDPLGPRMARHSPGLAWPL